MRTIYNPLNYIVETIFSKIFINGIEISDEIHDDYDLIIAPKQYSTYSRVLAPPEIIIGDCVVSYLPNIYFDMDQEIIIPNLFIYVCDDLFIINYMGKYSYNWGKLFGLCNGGIKIHDKRARNAEKIHLLGNEEYPGDGRLYKLKTIPVKKLVIKSNYGHYNPYCVSIGATSTYRTITDCGWPGNGAKYNEETKCYKVLGATIQKHKYHLCIFKDTDKIQFVGHIECKIEGFNIITFDKDDGLYYYEQ